MLFSTSLEPALVLLGVTFQLILACPTLPPQDVNETGSVTPTAEALETQTGTATPTQTTGLQTDATICGAPALSNCVSISLSSGTIPECLSLCQATSGCESFLYSTIDGDGVCDLGGLPASSCYGLTTASIAGGQVAYDKDCPAP
jgi:hypothetical protein